jgi:Undecaprenyl-phosphate glucose phosphotransferase
MTDNPLATPLFAERSVVSSLFADRETRALPDERQHGLARVSPTGFVWLTVMADGALLMALASSLGGLVVAPQYSPVVPILCGVFAIAVFRSARLYRIEVLGRFDRYMARFVKLWLASFVLVLAVHLLVSASPDAVLRFAAAAAVWFATGLLAFTALHYLVARLFQYAVKREVITHDVVVVGATELAAQFIRRVEAQKFGVRVRAVFDDDPASLAAPRLTDIRVRGNIADLLNYAKRNVIDTVVVALPLSDSMRMRQLAEQLSLQPLKVRMVPGAIALEMSPNRCAPTGEVPGIHLMAISDLPIERSGRVIKAVLDRTVALLALVVFGPLMLCCVLGIKMTSPGPVLFRQKRIGYRNREFSVYKFRSMHVTECDTGKLTDRNDPRVFPFGQIMRKLSFDELPQLFNVLRGDMSLVGPRPHMPEARAAGELYFDAVQKYAARHRVKPGITGWAQVNGWRGPTETIEQLENRVTHDLYYIDNWSIWLDVQILTKTAFVGFFGKNAF